MIEDIKKIELHCHLDGSVRPSTAAEYLGISIEEAESKMCYKEKASNLNEYLTKFDVPCSVMQTKDMLERVSRELGEDLVKDNIIYAEVRFAPHKHTKKGLSLDEVVESVLKGFRSVNNIKINVLLCMMRDFDEATNMEILDLYERFKDKGVCGIDLAGAEGLFPTINFKNLFDEAVRRGIPFTIHAGEADGVSSINAALSFGTKRVGHGIRAVDDNTLVNRMVNEDILFEVCPTSNLQTGASISYKEHPLRELFDQGASVLINTDNRTVSDTTLNEEIKYMVEAQGYTFDDIKQMMIMGAKHAFLSENEKNELINLLK